MQTDLIDRYSAPVPRYTSYPTAPHFSDRVQARDYADWLQALEPSAALSLYLHIPFCRQLCWYCGCSTKETRRYDPLPGYLDALKREIGLVSGLVCADHRVSHVHLGGGSPNVLVADDILRLGDALWHGFKLSKEAEIAVEVDPRWLEPTQVDAFAAIGVDRVSLGVQDFDPTVQVAINREQSFDETRYAVELFRESGVGSINIDLVYGLPHQTEASVTRTIEQVLTLAPDRIAVFGYAHLPARMKHQRLIDDATLPGAHERFRQAQRLAAILTSSGYVAVGLDHYARATDALASQAVRRNFQGYTTDAADALIGLGATSIGKLPQGYVQNAVPSGEYQARVRAGGLATVRGVRLTDDDRVRAAAIERLMCRLDFSASALRERFGLAALPVIAEAAALVREHRDGLVERTDDGFRVAEPGRPFVRTICARFDAHLAKGRAQHAPAV